MTQQQIDANVEVPVRAVVLGRARQILGQLPYDQVGTLPAEIDQALKLFAEAEAKRPTELPADEEI